MNLRTMAVRYASIDWSSPRLKLLDYGLSAATVAYGLHQQSWLIVGVGIAGAAATAWGLNARIVRGVQGVVRRRTGH